MNYFALQFNVYFRSSFYSSIYLILGSNLQYDHFYYLNTLLNSVFQSHSLCTLPRIYLPYLEEIIFLHRYYFSFQYFLRWFRFKVMFPALWFITSYSLFPMHITLLFQDILIISPHFAPVQLCFHQVNLLACYSFTSSDLFLFLKLKFLSLYS